MNSYLPAPDPITPAWLTAVLRTGGYLADGEVIGVTSQPLDAFNSQTSRVRLDYSDPAVELPQDMILKRNIPEPWAVEAGAQEVAFYRLVATLQPAPPAIVACYAAAYDPESGNSYVLLRDLSETHVHPITRDQQMSIVDGVPSARAIESVIDTLAQHHAYWWDHEVLSSEAFSVGYWTRNSERFALYMQRRTVAWDSLVADEASWFPEDFRELYTRVFAGLHQHWQTYLEPRFRTNTNLTLIHGDAYFANFLWNPALGSAYLIDWQSACVDIGGYDLANLCATFWTSEQRHESQRELLILQRYHAALTAHGVNNYTWEQLVTDYQIGIIYWLLVPLQDRYDGAPKEYWWPKMQCLVAAFREWHCEELM